MGIRVTWVIVLCSVMLGFANGATAEDLTQKVDQQAETIRRLEQRVDELETGASATPSVDAAPASTPPVATEGPAAEPGAAPSPVEDVERQMNAGQQARVKFRDDYNDRQTPAARAADYSFDPTYRGFFAVPRTPVIVKLNARPVLDFTATSAGAGTEYRFVPALFPVAGQPGYEGGWNFAGNANASQLRMDIKAPSVPGDLRIYYQNDFFGSNTSPMNYRLQHLYGQAFGVVAGFTYGIFEDPDAWPDTVDYEGPNALVFARRAVLQYKRMIATQWEITLGIEDPDAYIDVTGDAGAVGVGRGPDLGFNLRWTPENIVDHVQFSSIFRALGVSGGVFGDQTVFGWGLNLASAFDVTKRDTLTLYFVIGDGVGGMGNDTSFLNSDAAIDTTGSLDALRYGSAMAAFTHRWTPRWRSTATYGYVNLENTGMNVANTGINPLAYHESHYGSANVMYQVFKRVRVGVEGLVGYKELQDGSSQTIYRIQLGVAVMVFD